MRARRPRRIAAACAFESPSATEPRMRTFSAAHEHACSSITPDRSCLRILESPPTCARPAHDSYGQEHETLHTARGEHACSSITPDRSCLRILESPSATELRVRKPSARQLRAGARDAPHGARRACVLVDHAGSQLPAHLRARQPRSRGCARSAQRTTATGRSTRRSARRAASMRARRSRRIAAACAFESPAATEPRMRTFRATHDSHGQEHETLRTARGEHACSSTTPDRSCLRIL
ncbi:hypothetical protein NFJ02_38g96590 [Pycnococcus provasolii]